jgi:hypothetical protein
MSDQRQRIFICRDKLDRVLAGNGVPGEADWTCGLCGTPIVVTPASQPYLGRDNAKFLCNPCGARAAEALHGSPGKSVVQQGAFSEGGIGGEH